jgi:release factor glutamine methyltransferase
VIQTPRSKDSAGGPRASGERGRTQAAQSAARSEASAERSQRDAQAAQSAARSEATAERSPGTWTVLELLRWTTSHFASRGIESARLDAECLLAFALETTRLGLYVDFEKPVTEPERARFRELVRRRGRDRVPVAQLVGRKEFWSLSLRVTADVLAPRPETETLVEAALTRLPDRERPYAVLDLGTGSGAVALALAHERPRARIAATDISESALQIARQNAEELHLEDRIRWLRGSLFEPVRGERFDLVVSNPPYLARREASALPPELGHEPEPALFGGEDGTAVLRPLIEEVGEALVPGGWVALEVAPSQSERVAAWLTQAGLAEVETRRDLARHPRVVTARKPES